MTAPTPKIVDLYHEDNEHDFAELKMHGIIGIIHKATEGRTETDPAYWHRHEDAVAAGMLWGAYHFIRPGDVTKQVEHFLEHAPGADVLHVLDWEDKLVGMWAAVRFLELVRMQTGRTPWLYAGGLLRGRTVPPVFGEYPLWLAEYGPRAIVPLPWHRYTLWQYTERGDIADDLSHFDGTDDELRALWPVDHTKAVPSVVALAEPQPVESENAEPEPSPQSERDDGAERINHDVAGA